MKNRKRLMGVLLAAAMTAGSLAGCGSKAADSPSASQGGQSKATGEQARNDGDVVKIAVAGPMTGPCLSTSEQCQKSEN